MNLINVIKPTHICNLNCDYCFNDDVRQPIMSLQVLEDSTRETIEYARQNRNFSGVEFVWHGGEPLIAGLKYFEMAMEFQKKFAAGIVVSNNIQTNGLLLNEQWTNFFKQNNFSVSVSLDGIEEVHDFHRKDFGGNGSFRKTMTAIALLRQADIEPGIVMVATQAMKGRAAEIYRFLVDHQLPFQIVSLTKSGNARSTYNEMALTQAEYAALWIELFDYWLGGELGYVRCMEFENRLSALISGHPFGCEGQATCADSNISTDPIGDIYTCGTLSGTTELSYGNISRDSLQSLMQTGTAIHFRSRKVDPQCSTCEWQHVCHGGCMSRAYKIHDSIDVRDNGCEALWKTWSHMAKSIRAKNMSVAAPHPSHKHLEFSLPPEVLASRTELKKIIPIRVAL